jgi:ABC-2 type transport system permease protein
MLLGGKDKDYEKRGQGIMKRIANLILKDLAGARRDNIILYMLVAPILIAVIMAFFIPSFESNSLTFATSLKNEKLIQELDNYGRVLMLENNEKVKDRVYKNDDVAGIIEKNGSYRIILEGNESSEVGESVFLILRRIITGEDLAEYKYTVTGDPRSLLKQYAAIFIILMAIMVSGMVIGFNIIEEKESKAIKAISVSPVTMKHYLAARGIIVLVLSLIITLISSLILMGTDISFWKLILGVIFSSGMGILLGLIVGGIADNQIKGVALIKFIALPFTLIPVASIFVPERFLAFFYPFPNYWIFRIFENVFINAGDPGDYWLSCILTSSITIVLVLVMVFALRKRLRFR